MHFLQFFTKLSKKSKSIKAICIYTSERFRYALSENGIVYYAMTCCLGDISVWSRGILLNFCLVSIFFDILIANIILIYFNLMNGGWDPYKPFSGRV